ncbi:hypothetical protein [Acinetobacter kyonggiensis]|uniref:Uncharacterized protein n=1 Tax=Acinetobacter kyonggiensis TaxID=595670 RepID=A0A1H3HEC0_9GAMM|nr:hypothetical protein [Acinetobacter kyonggiensis]SDY13933.1 hypothetical protein SAMN05421643_10455 [Acinetobacter kyonggiensis]
MKIKYIIIKMLSLSILLIGNQTFGSTAFKIVKPSNKIGDGRCYMNECSYSKIVSSKIIKQDHKETRVRVSLLGGSSYNENGNYPSFGIPPKNIQWNKESHQVTAICSYKNPAIVMGNQVDDLDFSMIPGVLESSANLYFEICHNFYNGYYQGAKKFGYVN